MKKTIIRDKIFNKYYDGILNGFKLCELPNDLLPTDIIDLEKNESNYSENDSWDDHTILTVYRERKETDEEFNLRKLNLKERLEESKKQRFELYQKMK